METKPKDSIFETDSQVNRRDFLKTAGKTAAAVAIAGSALQMLTGCEKAYETTYPEKEELTYQFVAKPGEDDAPFPYPYKSSTPPPAQSALMPRISKRAAEASALPKVSSAN